MITCLSATNSQNNQYASRYLKKVKMSFKSWKNILRRPYIVFADTESSTKKLKDKKEHTSIFKILLHVYLSALYDHTQNRYWSQVGEDCIKLMVIKLSRGADECVDKLNRMNQQKLTKYERFCMSKCTCCHICNKIHKTDRSTSVWSWPRNR